MKITVIFADEQPVEIPVTETVADELIDAEAERLAFLDATAEYGFTFA